MATFELMFPLFYLQWKFFLERGSVPQVVQNSEVCVINIVQGTPPPVLDIKIPGKGNAVSEVYVIKILFVVCSQRHGVLSGIKVQCRLENSIFYTSVKNYVDSFVTKRAHLPNSKSLLHIGQFRVRCKLNHDW